MRFRFPALLVAATIVTLILAGQFMNASPADGYRAPDEVRRTGNHLKSESSLYLQQHAHNPLDWYPWGDEAFRRAQAEDKPIFLSIGYSSCHWCHVMEHEVFDHDDVAEFMNRHFICIKVDREERPDLDVVYMDAVQAITGRGGWPLSVFLTPERKPFFGGTYFPHDDFLQLAGKIREVYLERRDELEGQAARLAASVTQLPDLVGLPATGDGAVGAELIESAASQAEVNFDGKWGGFKGQQKFPVPVRWRFLLHHYRKTGDERYANLVSKTLESMASGGIYDHVGGGFHRYTVDKMWLVPHFEKMLYDNAQLASLYLEAGAVLERSDFTTVGVDVLDFLLREMRDERGGFCSSFDADSGGQEGTYYVWTEDDMARATDRERGPVLSSLLGVAEPGNFEHGTSVLTRRADLGAVAAEHDWSPDEVAGLLARERTALREYRAKRIAPGLDRKIVTSWNGLTISALCHGYASTGQERFQQAAVKAAAYLWQVHHRGEGRLHRASNNGQAIHDAIIDDHAFLAAGLLDLFQITGQAKHLERALLVIDRALMEFRHEKGGFYLTAASSEAPLGRKVEFFDSVIPSGNAGMMSTLLKVSALTGHQDYRGIVVEALAAYRTLMQRAQLEMAGWLDAATQLNGPMYEVVISGSVDDEKTEELTGAVLSTLPAHIVLARVPAKGAGAKLARLMPPAAGKTAGEGSALAFVCELGACQAPTADLAVLRQQLRVGWAK